MLLSRRVTFFGGKGGVGKTTIAAATALQAADSGLRTLLVSTDPAHSTGDIFGLEFGDEAMSVSPMLDVVELDPEREAERYIGTVKDRLAEAVPPRLVAEVERQIDIARASPGAGEAALFERFARVLEESVGYRRLVFDTAPTGHTLRLLGLPEQMTTWMSGLIQRRRKVESLGRMWRNVAGAAASDSRSGPGEWSATVSEAEDPLLAALIERRDRFIRVRSVLTDPEQTSFTFVVTPRRLPVLETMRAVAALQKYDIPIGGIVVNRADDVPGHGSQTERVASEDGGWPIGGTDCAGLPRWTVPTLPGEVVGLDALRRAAHAVSPSRPLAPAGLEGGRP